MLSRLLCSGIEQKTCTNKRRGAFHLPSFYTYINDAGWNTSTDPLRSSYLEYGSCHLQSTAPGKELGAAQNREGTNREGAQGQKVRGPELTWKGRSSPAMRWDRHVLENVGRRPREQHSQDFSPIPDQNHRFPPGLIQSFITTNPRRIPKSVSSVVKMASVHLNLKGQAGHSHPGSQPPVRSA